MRKQDRIANQQPSGEQHSSESKPEPRESERMTGSGSTERMRGSSSEETRRPERPQGRLPLPD